MSKDELANLDLFSVLKPEQRADLAALARRRDLADGQVLFRQGDEGDEVYVVIDGAIRIYHQLTVDVHRTLAELGPGSMFGEAAIIDRSERSASAQALGSASLLVFDAEPLRDWMIVNPAAGLLLLGRLGAMMLDRLRRTNMQLKDAMNWGLEVSGAAHLRFSELIRTRAPVEVHLVSGGRVTGTLVRVDRGDPTQQGEPDLWIAGTDGQMHVVRWGGVADLTFLAVAARPASEET